MEGDPQISPEIGSLDEDQPARKRKRRWAKRLGWAIVILLAPLVLAAAFLSSPIGKRFVTDQIAQLAPASGLRFEVGRIEGDIYGAATLHDVKVLDPKGVFLTIPEVDLDWRPLAYLWSGIDIRELTARRGTLQRVPELLPGDPDAPILPDFDIRVDHFGIDNLTLAPGVAGEAAQRVDFDARIDIRSGRALVDAQGAFGPEDRIDLRLDAEPDGDRFELALDYNAADDGPIAALAGLTAGYQAKIVGEGTWTRWLGHAVVTREAEGEERARVAAFELTNLAGTYGLVGQLRPTLDDGSILDTALGDAVSLAARGTFEESIFDGRIAAVTDALDLRTAGAISLADNRVDDLVTSAVLRDPDLLGETARLEGARIDAELDGPFRNLLIDHQLSIAALGVAQTVRIEDLRQSARARFDGEALDLPLDATVARVITGNDIADPMLEGGRMTGALSLSGGVLSTDAVAIVFPGLEAELTLTGDLASGAYALAGPVETSGVALPDIGRVNGAGRIRARFGSGAPWSLEAEANGFLDQIANASIVTLAGERIEFRGGLAMGGERPIALDEVVIASQRLQAQLDSVIEGDTTTLAGSGRHTQYGPFTFDATIDGSGPRAQVVLADPLPAAGLANVRVGIAPEDDGFALDVAGGSLLGPFDGALGVVLPGDGPTLVNIERLNVTRTNVTGTLALRDDGVVGDLALAGGGLSGTIGIAPGDAGAQIFAVNLTARQARFEGPTTLGIANADIDASGYFDGSDSSIEADIAGSGLQYGMLSIANFTGRASLRNGSGDLVGAIAGRRADRFELRFDGDFAPQRIALIAQGDYGGQAITMPQRAVLTALDGGGYRLAPAQIGYARGFAILEGEFGGSRTAIEARLARMPLRLADLAGADLGLGGRVSGVLGWNQRGSAPPTGTARVRIDDFTRSGLILSSHPVDVYTVVNLTAGELRGGARIREDQTDLGRVRAAITRLPRSGDIATRLQRGRLDASLSYDGDAAAIWRLAAIETFDLVGPVDLQARATGTLLDPRIRGSLSSDDLRLQSAIAGMDIRAISAAGRFAGSRLELTRFAGRTYGGGTVSGSGIVDLAGMSAARGPRIDIRAAVNEARLINANGLDATLTGPLRIVSNGVGGAIAGRVQVVRASWALGIAAQDVRLPQIATREINRPGVLAASERSSVTGSWRYLVDAETSGGVAVDGLGLDSEWAVDIALRGTVDDPRIGGQANLVRGDYTFAGTRFELTRGGRITFDENVPIDPRLDLEARASANGTDVVIDITGNAQTPEIAFSSVPALPQEEILARLLFGGSVTSLSATDAVQLGAALAALQGGGGGLDPIGDLRRSIGLDQLRIVAADPALGRGTGVALGKNLGRRVYVELITDGQGYSATQVEYRVTSWLALLASVTTIGRDSALIQIRRDY